jgi:hypothetical protein
MSLLYITESQFCYIRAASHNSTSEIKLRLRSIKLSFDAMEPNCLHTAPDFVFLRFVVLVKEKLIKLY